LFVDAVAVGHDLNRGTTAFLRTERPAVRDDDTDDIALMRRLDGAGAGGDPVTGPVGAPGVGQGAQPGAA
jgi:hypothetical protein